MSELETSRRVDALECPAGAYGIIQLLRLVLTHNVHSITIRPGVEMEVDWVANPGESLLQPLPAESVAEALGRVALTEIEPESTPMGSLKDALVWLSARGLYPSFMVVQSETWLREVLNIPSVVALPELVDTTGDAEYKLLMGCALAEWESLAQGCLVLIAGELPGAELAECKRAVQVRLSGV